MVRCVMISKYSKVVCLILLLSFQSCALLTSYKKFSLERDTRFTFQEKTSFYDGKTHSLIFYEDSSCLLMSLPKQWIESYLTRKHSKIHSRIPGDRFYHWGIYQVQQDTVSIELMEKVDQLGFMGIIRWVAVLKNEGKRLELLPGDL